MTRIAAAAAAAAAAGAHARTRARTRARSHAASRAASAHVRRASHVRSRTSHSHLRASEIVPRGRSAADPRVTRIRGESQQNLEQEAIGTAFGRDRPSPEFGSIRASTRIPSPQLIMIECIRNAGGGGGDGSIWRAIGARARARVITSCSSARLFLLVSTPSGPLSSLSSELKTRWRPMNVESAEPPSEIARARLGVVDCLERNELRVPGCVRSSPSTCLFY